MTHSANVYTTYGGEVVWPLGTIPWLPSEVTQDINGVTNSQRFEYDPFGRLARTYNPNIDGAETRYYYNDTNWSWLGQSSSPHSLNQLGVFAVWQGVINSNFSYLAHPSLTVYDGLGRAIQSQLFNETLNSTVVTTTEYDALGRAFCQTAPVTAPYGPVYSDFICSDNAEKTITTFGDFGQPVATTAPDGSISQALAGQYAGYTVTPNKVNGQFTHYLVNSQFSNQLGQLKGVDEQKVNFTQTFNVGSNFNEWNVIGAVSIHDSNNHALLSYENEVIPELNRLVDVINEPAAVMFEFASSDVNNGHTWFSLEKGTWGNSDYRLWGLFIEGGLLKLQQWSADGEHKTTLLPAGDNDTWYKVMLRTSRSSDQEFVLVVWDALNPAKMAEIKITQTDPVWFTGQWSFTTKTTRGSLAIDNYTEAEVYRTSYHYNLLGGLESVVDAAGNTTSSMTYDNFGRKIGMTDADMGTWKYQYNAVGNLTKQIANPGTADQKVLCFYYDGINRLAAKMKAPANEQNCTGFVASDNPNWLADYYYSGPYLMGTSWRRDTVNNTGVDSELMSYDYQWRLTHHERVINGQSFVMQYDAFDLLNRPTTITYPDGEVVVTTYDKDGEDRLRINTVNGAGGTQIVDSVQYNHLGQMTQFNRSGGGGDTTYSYYGAAGNYRLQTINHQGVLAEDNLPNYSYGYDAIGNIVDITEYLPGYAPANSEFTYDSLNRLLVAAYTDNAPDLMMNYEEKTFAYDKLGNMVSKNGATYGYNSTQPHAVDSITSGQDTSIFGYDAAGNMTTRETPEGNYEQEFDTENRLVKVINSDTGHTTLFYYDAAGQRTMTVEPDATTTYYPFPNFEKEVPGDTTTLFSSGFETEGDWTPVVWSPATAMMRNTGGTAESNGGDYAYSISNLANGQLVSSQFNVEPDTEYGAYVSVRGGVDPNSSVWNDYDFYVVEYNSAGTAINYELIADGFVTASWEQVGNTFTTQSDTVKVAIALYAQYNDGWVAFDNVIFEDANTKEANLVPDPGFELGTGWGTYAPPTHSGTSFMRTTAGTATPQSGSYGYSISNHAWGRLASQKFNVQGNTNYTFSVWVKGETNPVNSLGNKFVTYIAYYDASNQLLSYAPLSSATPPADWQQYTQSHTSPSNATKAEIWLFNTYNSGWINFDDVSVVKNSTTTNLVYDPSFEIGDGWTPYYSPHHPGTFYQRTNGGGTSTPHSGSYGYSMSNHSWGMVKTPALDVVPGRTYNLSLWVRGELSSATMAGSGMDAVVVYYDAQNVQIGDPEHIIHGNVTATWQQKSDSFVTPPGTAKIVVQLMNMYNNGWLAYDDVTITASQTAPIVRKTYMAAGQPVAMNIAGNSDPAKNGLFFIYSDHLRAFQSVC